MIDQCINCSEELLIWERNRCECLDCRERTIETYEEEIVESFDET